MHVEMLDLHLVLYLLEQVYESPEQCVKLVFIFGLRHFIGQILHQFSHRGPVVVVCYVHALGNELRLHIPQPVVLEAEMHQVIHHFFEEILAKGLFEDVLIPIVISEDVQQLYASDKANRKLVICQYHARDRELLQSFFSSTSFILCTDQLGLHEKRVRPLLLVTAAILILRNRALNSLAVGLEEFEQAANDLVRPDSLKTQRINFIWILHHDLLIILLLFLLVFLLLR